MASFVERFQAIEKVGVLSNKGYKFTEIARELDVTPAQASLLVSEYKELLRLRAEGDSDFLERITQNTLEMLDSLDTILKEAWEAYEKAKEFDMINMQATTLKLAMDITERKSKLLQLMGARSDGGSVARLNKAERVNEIVSMVVKDIISDCERCRVLAQIKLAEAFALMGKEEEAATMQEMAEENLIEIEESVEVEREDHSHILGDVLSED